MFIKVNIMESIIKIQGCALAEPQGLQAQSPAVGVSMRPQFSPPHGWVHGFGCLSMTSLQSCGKWKRHLHNYANDDKIAYFLNILKSEISSSLCRKLTMPEKLVRCPENDGFLCGREESNSRR